MPVTAKLSRKFYEKLGDEVANELVDWLNTVDLSYRHEFRELFETHFSRFEARLAQHTAETRRELDRLETKLVRWMFLFWIGSVGTLIALQHFR